VGYAQIIELISLKFKPGARTVAIYSNHSGSFYSKILIKVHFYQLFCDFISFFIIFSQQTACFSLSSGLYSDKMDLYSYNYRKKNTLYYEEKNQDTKYHLLEYCRHADFYSPVHIHMHFQSETVSFFSRIIPTICPLQRFR